MQTKEQDMNPEIMKHNYRRGLWSKQMVLKAARKGAITAEDYRDITGEELPMEPTTAPSGE